MAELRIPPEYERGFVEIRRLDEDQVEELVSAFNDEGPMSGRSDLRRRVVQKVATVEPDDLNEVISTLFSIYPLQEDMGLTTSDTAEAICNAMDQSDASDLAFSDDADRSHFKAKLIELLSVNALQITARATDLLYEHERTLHGKPRILTDIRPVFGEDPEDPPKGAMVLHTLKLSHHQDGEIKEFFITLDGNEIDELISVLGRASVKAGSLRTALVAAEIPYIDPGQGAREGRA